MADEDPKKPQESELDELELRAQEILAHAENLRTQRLPPDEEADFQERLAQLESRASAAKEGRVAKQQTEKRRIASDAESARGLGVGMSIAYVIIGLPLFGALGGWLIDRQLGTKIWIGFGTLIGATLGVACAIVMLNRANNQK